MSTNVNQRTFMALDVESIGLHGDGFAVGWALVVDGVEIDFERYACNPETVSGTGANREWVRQNVEIPPSFCSDRAALMNRFWGEWTFYHEKYGVFLLTDCGWPVEANFLSDCVRQSPATREWEGPYPMVDLSTLLLVRGLDPTATYERLPGELPAHDPLADARQTARLWLENLPFNGGSR